MRVWEKPVLSVLGVSKTKGSSFKALDGVAVFSDDLDFVSPDCWKGRGSGGRGGGSGSDSNTEPSSYSGSDS